MNVRVRMPAGRLSAKAAIIPNGKIIPKNAEELKCKIEFKLSLILFISNKNRIKAIKELKNDIQKIYTIKFSPEEITTLLAINILP